MVKQIEYEKLPVDFWNKVVYYEYFVSFSGFIDAEPHITMWTLDGEKYCVNVEELRDGRFERVIPFFESMTVKEKIIKGNFLRFDWKLVPNGWTYYYNRSNHCFIPTDVYKEFLREYEKVEKFSAEELVDDKKIENFIVQYMLWKKILKQAYNKVLGLDINEEDITYIRFDEKNALRDE